MLEVPPRVPAVPVTRVRAHRRGSATRCGGYTGGGRRRRGQALQRAWASVGRPAEGPGPSGSEAELPWSLKGLSCGRRPAAAVASCPGAGSRPGVSGRRTVAQRQGGACSKAVPCPAGCRGAPEPEPGAVSLARPGPSERPRLSLWKRVGVRSPWLRGARHLVSHPGHQVTCCRPPQHIQVLVTLRKGPGELSCGRNPSGHGNPRTHGLCRYSGDQLAETERSPASCRRACRAHSAQTSVPRPRTPARAACPPLTAGPHRSAPPALCLGRDPSPHRGIWTFARLVPPTSPIRSAISAVLTGTF